MRMISAAVNKKPGPDASLRKALADPHGKRVFGLAKDLMGADGMLGSGDPVAPQWEPWVRGFLFSPALTVGGGTSEVLRNIIGERLLGLPHDVDIEQPYRPRVFRVRHAITDAIRPQALVPTRTMSYVADAPAELMMLSRSAVPAVTVQPAAGPAQQKNPPALSA